MDSKVDPIILIQGGKVLVAYDPTNDNVFSYKKTTITYSASFSGTITQTVEGNNEGETLELNTVYDCSISGTFELGPCASCTLEDSKIETCQIQVDRIEYDSETNDRYVVTEPQDVYQFVEVFSGPSGAYPPNGLQNYISVNFGRYNFSNYSYDSTEYICPDDFPKTFNYTALDTFYPYVYPYGYEGTLTLTVNYTISIDR